MAHDDDTLEDGGMVLVVEDDAELRGALSRILRYEGHEVVEAGTGQQAMEIARRSRPSLMVVDAMMPGMDGEMVVRALRSEMRDTAPPAVMLSVTESQHERAGTIGAAASLVKPFAVEDLLRAVRDYKRRAKSDA